MTESQEPQIIDQDVICFLESLTKYSDKKPKKSKRKEPNKFEQDTIQTIHLLKELHERYVPNGKNQKKSREKLKLTFHKLNTFGELVESKFPDIIKENLKNINKKNEDLPGESILFEFLNKVEDENYYSDYISALMNPQKMGKFAHRFLYKLVSSNPKISQLSGTTSQEKEYNFDFIKPHREVSLTDFPVEKQYQKMRIDILVVTDRFVLILENKTKTEEHNDQTVIYYDAVEQKYKHRQTRIFGLFLTPLGSIAIKKDKYSNFSYRDFIEVLEESVREMKDLLDSKRLSFVKTFLHELKCRYIYPCCKNLYNAQNFRGAYGKQ